MAIQIQFEDEYGTIHPTAYAKIKKIIASYGPFPVPAIANPPDLPNKRVSANVLIYVSKNAMNNDKKPLAQMDFHNIPDTAVNPDIIRIADVYTWLKTLPEFIAGSDV